MAFNYDRFRTGLGNVRNALLPIPEEVASQLDPRTIEALRKQAMLQMGLGMMGAGEKGAGLGTGALFGLNEAQRGLGQGVNQAWMGQRAAREDTRLEQQDRRLTQQMERDAARDTESRRRWEEDKKLERARMLADEEWRRAQLGHTGTSEARQAELLRLSQEDAQRERDAEARIRGLIKRQNTHLAKGGKRGDATWQTYQDAIDNYAGRSVDRSLEGGLGLGGAAANPFDTAAPPPWERPKGRPVDPMLGLGQVPITAERIPVPAAAGRGQVVAPQGVHAIYGRGAAAPPQAARVEPMNRPTQDLSRVRPEVTDPVERARLGLPPLRWR